MNQEEGQSPGLFSHESAATEVPNADAGDSPTMRPVFSRTDGPAPGAYLPADDAS